MYAALNAYHVTKSAVIIRRLATGLDALILAATTAVKGIVGVINVSSHNCVASIDEATGRVFDCVICRLLFVVATDALWIDAKAVIAAMQKSTLEVATIVFKIAE